MAAEGKPVGQKKRGRRTTGHNALTTIRLSSELRESVDAWAAKQNDKPARPEAILRLVELGLETTPLRNRAAKASEMAAREIDRLSKRRVYRPGVFDGRTDRLTTFFILFDRELSFMNHRPVSPPSVDKG